MSLCGVCLVLIMCMVCDWVWCVYIVQLGVLYVVQLMVMCDVCLQLGVMCVWYGLVCNWAWCVLLFSACSSTFVLVSSLHAAPSFMIVLLWSGVLGPGQL